MIFEDPSRRRWRIAVGTFTAVALAGLVLFSLSAAALINPPELPTLHPTVAQADTATTNLALVVPMTDHVSEARTDAQWQFTTVAFGPHQPAATPDDIPSLKSFRKNGSSLRSAFLLQEDANSVHSFQEHASQLDLVFPDWFFLNQTDCSGSARIRPAVRDVLEQSGVTFFARIADGEGGTSYAEETRKIMHDAQLRTCIADRIAATTKTNGGKGVLVDIESLRGSDASDYVAFLTAIKQAASAHGLPMLVAVPSGSLAYPIDAITRIADGVLVILHGEHYPTSTPGPVASQGWFDETLTHFSKIVPSDKLLVGLGSYGLDWTLAPTGTASGLTYGDVMSEARAVKATPSLSDNAKNMAFAYQDDRGHPHVVWFLDAISMWNEWLSVQKSHALGTAVWRLGSEDPNIWSFIGQTHVSGPPTTVPPLPGVYSASQSEIYHVSDVPTAGQLTLAHAADGTITSATYSKLPTGFVLERIGSAPPDKTLVLAVVGGPDPSWTTRLLDLLDAQDVPAVFFVNGNASEKNPGTLKSIADRGYLIGNGGYDASDVQNTDQDALRANVNVTQRLIENATQHHSLLFEAPMPTQADLATSLRALNDMGYVIVSPRAGSDTAQESSSDIVNRVKAQVTMPERHVIAIPGDGTNADAQFAALQTLIPELKAQGYSFVRIDQAMNVSQGELAPNYNGNEALFVTATGFSNTARQLFWPTITWLFVLTTAFSVMRILFMFVFAARSVAHLKNRKRYRNPSMKYISILIPAYNEEETIGKTLRSVQQSTHRRYEILVIDDGSTDHTADVVRRYAARDRRIRLLQKPNGGKATALNLGMRAAKYDIVVTIDADTVLQPQAITELILPFADRRVDAVCGNVEVGNTHNIITGFQTLEYITAQNFDRRAFDELNAISVVPGATGAWRRRRVLAIGGYENDTLTEDADLTIKMLASGGKIVYAPEARSRTEAPDTIRDLARQRFRWSFGTFQVLGKYAGKFLEAGGVGRFALPNIFIFQILFPLLAPVGDFVFILSIIHGDWQNLLWSYVFFTILDVTGSIFAFVLDKKPKQLMLFALIQRFFYRQLLYVTIIRAIIAMLRGGRYGWNKLQRTGTVAVVGTT